MRKLLVRGMLSGLAAGLLALVFAYVLGEPSVGGAIDFEEAKQAAEGQVSEPELVSRAVQSTVGLATGIVVYAVAFGGLFACVFALAYGRVGNLSARATAALVALGGYLSAFVVPFLKYPANPPAVSDPETINERTVLYFGMVLMSVALLASSVAVARRLTPRLGGWYATLLAALSYVAAVSIAGLVLPTVDTFPDGFPAALLWDFRVASLGTQLVMWTAMGLFFGALVQRLLQRGQSLSIQDSPARAA